MHKIIKFILGSSLTILAIQSCYSQELLPFRQDSLWGFRNLQGQNKIPPQYKFVSNFAGKYAIVSDGHLLGAINKDNVLVIPIRYDFLKGLDEENFLFGDKSKYFGEYIMGVISSDNREIIPKEYSYIINKQNNYIVKKNIDSVIAKTSLGDVRSVKSLYGLFSSNGKVLIPCRYSYIMWVNDKLLIVTKDFQGTHEALFNSKGKQLTGFEYVVIGEFKEDLAKVRIGNKYGFIDLNGNEVIPVEFQYCEDFINGYALIQKHKMWGAIDKHGKIVVKPNQDYQNVIKYLEEKFGRRQVLEKIVVDM